LWGRPVPGSCSGVDQDLSSSQAGGLAGLGPTMTRFALVYSTLAFAGLAGLLLWLGLYILPWPLSLAVLPALFVCTIWALAGLYSMSTLLASPGGTGAPLEVKKAWDVELLPQLRGGQENLLIQQQDTLSNRDPLTAQDMAWLLVQAFRVGSVARGRFVGCPIPSGRRLTRWQYDGWVQLVGRAGLVVDRKPGYAGRLGPGVTLSQALRAMAMDPESVPDAWLSPGYTWPGLARPGRGARFQVSRVIKPGDLGE